MKVVDDKPKQTPSWYNLFMKDEMEKQEQQEALSLPEKEDDKPIQGPAWYKLFMKEQMEK